MGVKGAEAYGVMIPRQCLSTKPGAEVLSKQLNEALENIPWRKAYRRKDRILYPNDSS